MASSSLTSIMTSTADLLSRIQQSKKNCNAIQDLKELSKTLKRIHAVLFDAEAREIRDKSVELWLSELKSVAYDAEDVIDEVNYDVLRAQMETQDAKLSDEQAHILTSEFMDMKEFSFLDDISDRIKEIREKFEEISKARHALHLREEDGRRYHDTSDKYPPPTSHLVNESEIFGRDSDKQKVIQLLLSSRNSKFSVISIVGKGGLGKTTLAQLVYSDRRVIEYFNKRIWICVSEHFDIFRLTKTMVEYLTRMPSSCSELSLLQDTLQVKLNKKNLLLVLDDVWNEQKNLWEALKLPLMVGELVQVIVTTRNESVAEIMETVSSYRLDYLRENDCWSLFIHHAFHRRNLDEFPNLVEIGRKIIKKCGGLPLAIKSLGGLLEQEEDEDSWEDVLHSELWQLPKETEILPALRLSYNRLPIYLKPCFLYFAMFPKDYCFDQNELAKLWIAQGYIQPNIDIAIKYFKELQRRSFLDPYQQDTFGVRLVTFKMHDSIHDLARHLAGNECHITVETIPSTVISGGFRRNIDSQVLESSLLPGYNYFNILYSPKNDSPVSVETKQLDVITDDIRHLYLVGSEMQMARNPATLRTLFFVLKNSSEIIYKSCCQHMLKMKRLRAIKFENSYSDKQELPNEFGNLKHLRYLQIKLSRIQRLPDTVGYLHNLLTLDFCGCQYLEELPENLGNLFKLQHLLLRNCRSLQRLPKSMSQLYNLETLDLANCQSLYELPTGIVHLCNLRHLNLISSKVTQLAGMGKLTKLEKLYYRPNLPYWFEIEEIGELKDMVNLRGPLCLYGLDNILSAEEAKLASLSTKHQLKSLKLLWKGWCVESMEQHLHIKVRSTSGSKSVINDKLQEAIAEVLQPHTKIEELEIHGYDGLRFPSWISRASFTKLTRIALGDCGTPCLPTLGQLPFLKILHIKTCAVKSIGDEFCSFGIRNSSTKTKTVTFPSLMNLEFSSMPNWEEWYVMLDGNFPQLLELKIINCCNLKILPILPSSVEFLSLLSCDSLKCLPLAPNFSCPSQLRKLRIEECSKLNSLLGLPNLVHLTKVEVLHCPALELPDTSKLKEKFQITNV